VKSCLRVLDSGGADAGFNMALDEAILDGVIEGVSPPTLRFYSFTHPAVTLGRFQKLSDSFRMRVDSMGLSLVRRPTGGRAVVHDGDLTYSVAASVGDPELGGSTRETYRKISSRLALAFSLAGVEVASGSRGNHSKYSRSASCFDTTVLHELTYMGEKVAAGAQVRRSGAFLQQGTIPISCPDADFTVLFGDCSRGPRGLHSLAGDTLDVEELKKKILECFGSSGPVGAPNLFELVRAEQLLAKYGSSDWNLRGENTDATKVYAGSY
jgi:lipoate-protein ligase A